MTISEAAPIAVGQQVSLGLTLHDGFRWVQGRVLSWQEQCLWIGNLPYDLLEPAHLASQDVLAYTWRLTDALYALHASVATLDPSLGRIALQVREVARIQRRGFFRVEVRIPCDDARLVSQDDEPPSLERGGWPLQVQIADLSAGGCSARVQVAAEPSPALELAIGQLLALTFHLVPDDRPISAEARVVRVVEHDRPRAGESEIGAQFIALDTSTSERLIRYVLGVQTEYVRRKRI
jgi:hypothetical protein